MYFDKTLPVMLLYKRERQQYHDAITDNVSPSTVYGAEHLLRLFGKYISPGECVFVPISKISIPVFFNFFSFCSFRPHHSNFHSCVFDFFLFAVKMPELLSYVNMEEETLTQLQQKLHDFLKYDINSSIHYIQKFLG